MVLFQCNNSNLLGRGRRPPVFAGPYNLRTLAVWQLRTWNEGIPRNVTSEPKQCIVTTFHILVNSLFSISCHSNVYNVCD